MAASWPGRLARDPRVRFLAVGAFNTSFAYVVYAALVLPGVPYLLALLVAHVLSVLVAFVLYRRLVFAVRGRVLGDLWRFWSVYLGALALNVALLPLLVEGAGITPLLAQGLLAGLSAASSWLGHSRFSFRRTTRPTPARPTAAAPEVHR